MRLHMCTDAGEDVVQCHNEKLASGSDNLFIESCRRFFATTVFGNGTSWPTVILAPSQVDDGPNFDITVSDVFPVNSPSISCMTLSEIPNLQRRAERVELFIHHAVLQQR